MTKQLKPHQIDTAATTSDGQTMAYSKTPGEVVWVAKSVPVIIMPAGSKPKDLPSGLPVGTIILVRKA